MDKRKFDELLSYLKNRPSEAARLMKVLEPCFCKQTETPRCETPKESGHGNGLAGWRTAREVGQYIGMSSRWVRDRIILLPQTQIRQVGTKRQWLIAPEAIEVLTKYTQKQ